jgi:nucleoside phosphorylase
MLDTFPSLRVGLMVGIGGGIPPKVRLGDVVVSSPSGEFSGVVQWDFGKKLEGGRFERTGSLDTPPRLLLTALSRLETDNEMYGSKIPRYLEELVQRHPRLKAKYSRSESLKDVLFKADYPHSKTAGIDDEARSESCQSCDKSKVVQRPPRDTGDMPVVHYGLIASGNQVIKDAVHRSMLNSDLGGQVLCVEMEAAGLMNSFPCVVVRGICDYADSHKNKDWQEYAAAVAAALAKELLGYIQPHDMKEEPPAKNVVSPPPADIHVPMPPPANSPPASRPQANNNPTTNNSQGTRLVDDWDAGPYGLYIDTGSDSEDIYYPYLGDASAQNPYIDGLSADDPFLADLSAEHPYIDAWDGD